MDIERTIMTSVWWAKALKTPDRHRPPDSSVVLADHLVSVRERVDVILDPAPSTPFLESLHDFLNVQGLELQKLRDILIPVALLHDIGKPEEDKTVSVFHPIARKEVAKRHPVVSTIAADEILPSNVVNRTTILALVSEHDTPYSWYVQARKAGTIPQTKSWGRLDARIGGQQDGLGIVLLAIFKLADTDGHDEVDDVPWFFVHSNDRYLERLGRALPVPNVSDVLAIETESGS